MLAEPGAEATILESWAGEIDGPAWTNAVTEFDIRRRRERHLCEGQDEAEPAFHLGRTKVRLAEKAVFDAFVLSTGGRLARSEVLVDHVGRVQQIHRQRRLYRP